MLFKLFSTFFKIGAFTFGGGYAMLPLIEAEIVEKNDWLSSEDFLDIIAMAQSAPGAVAVNSSIFIGYKLKGFRGAAACLLGTVLPSFTIILIVATLLYQYRENPIIDRAFYGIRAAVVALIVAAVYKLGKKSKIKLTGILVGLTVVLAIAFLRVSPIMVIILGALIGIIYNKSKEDKAKRLEGEK